MERRQIQHGCVAVGHPVDVASGTLFHDFTDFLIRGSVPLSFGRRYSTALIERAGGMFGPGWSSPFEMVLQRDIDGFRMSSESGDGEVRFEYGADAAPGGRVVDFAAFHELSREGDVLVVTRWSAGGDDIVRYLFPLVNTAPVSLAARQAADGRSIQVERDRTGRIIAIHQVRERRVLSLDYDRAGRLVKVFLIGSSRADGRQVLRYSYDDGGRLAEVEDAAGHVARYRYDTAGRMVSERTFLGMEYRFRYDASGRCVESSGDDRFDFNTLLFDDVAKITRVTNSDGAVTTYHWNESGQVVRQVSPLGCELQTTYDKFGRIVEIVRPNGAALSYEFDAVGNRAKVVAPTGREASYEYNDRHQLTALTDGGGQRWLRHIDGNGRIVGFVVPGGVTWSYSYNAAGDVVAVTDPRGKSTTLERDQYGNVIRVTDRRGRTRRFQYDDVGRVVVAIDGSEDRTTFAYDALDRIASIRVPDGGERRFTRNAFGQLERFVDERGEVTEWRHGPCGLLTEVIRPSGARLAFEWSLVPGRVVAVTNELGERQAFDYDLDGRVISMTDFAGRRNVFEWSKAELVAEVDASGQRTEYTRNLEGAIVSITFGDGSQTSFEYDSCGRLARADNGECEVAFSFDEQGRVVLERQGDVTIASTYDDFGRRIERTSSLGLRTTFEWGPEGLLASLRCGAHPVVHFAYDEPGNEILRRVAGGVAIQSGYDSRGRLAEVTVGLGGEVGSLGAPWAARWFNRRRFEYDASSNLRAIHDAKTGSSVFDYDVDSRLTRARFADGVTEGFGYDATDNIRTVERIGLPSHGASISSIGLRHWTYGAGNQLVERDGVRYEYDAVGQLLRKIEGDRISEFEWRRRGELSRVRLPDGSTWTYRYDPLGRRIEKRNGDRLVRYIWDRDAVLHEIRANGTGPDEVRHLEFHPSSSTPILYVVGGTPHLCLQDATGLPWQLVTVDGHVVWSAEFDSYGTLRSLGKDTIDFPVRFAGQWHDAETGLHYNRFRYYEPSTGRYISRDPLGLTGGMNGYIYTANPFAFIDPFGLTKLCGHIPPGSTIIEDKSPDYMIFKAPDGSEKIIFRADEAVTAQDAAPGRNYSTDTLCGIDPDGKPYVFEGRHRSIGASQGGTVDPSNGGVPTAPGYLIFDYNPDPAPAGGIPVKSLTIDHTEPDVPADQARAIRKKKYGVS
jgi:RHS repeat-associated protein